MRIRIFVIQLVGVDGCESYLTDIIFWKLNRLIKSEDFFQKILTVLVKLHCTGGAVTQWDQGASHIQHNVKW